MKYLSLKSAIEIHDMIIEKTGGFLGVRNSGQIESILENIKNDTYYPDFYDKITHLIFSLVKFHCFNDGNKRGAIGVGGAFLIINDYPPEKIKFFMRSCEILVVDVAEGLIDKAELRKIFEIILE